MKTRVLSNGFATALFGFVLVLSSMVSTNAQGLGYIASSKKDMLPVKGEVVWNDEEKDALNFEDISIEIPEVATVTFINKYGEVVAVLKGEKSVLDDKYRDRVSRSYFLSSYGIHEVYLLR